MSFTLGNGWDPDFGYFSYRGLRAVGQRLHPACKQAKAYKLPEGFLPGRWKAWNVLWSVHRSSTFRPKINDARSRQFYRAMNRNPAYYSNIADRPAGALRLGYAWNWRQKKSTSDVAREEHGPRQISIEVSAETARLLEELATRCAEADQDSNGFTSHGPLTIDGLVSMLVEDAAMVIDRPGSWEGANMARVFACHGYDV